VGSPSLHPFVFKGPAVNATHALRAAGVQAEARRGRAPRGAWTPASTGLYSTAAGPPLNSQKRCIHFGEEPKKYAASGFSVAMVDSISFWRSPALIAVLPASTGIGSVLSVVEK